ncbi:MAG: glycosyltransferase family 4 protein [Candidatus Brocadiia bacterium]
MGKDTVHVRKVLLLAPQMEARGTSAYTVNLARELQESEVDVGVFCVPGPSQAVLAREGVPTQVFDRLSGLGFRLARGRFLGAVEEFAPQLVHAQSYRATTALKLLNRRTDAALLLTIHGMPASRRSLRRLSRGLDGIIATTQSVREGLVNQCKVNRRKIQVIHNGIDVDSVPEDAIPPPFQGRSPVVGSVGPVEERRGHELFAQAAAILVRGGSTAQFVIAGMGEELPELRKLVGRLGLERYMTIATDFAEYEEVLGALDVVVQSSLVDVSGFSILEAMGYQRPVIAFNTGTACEMIEDSRTGLLVPKGDVEALADAIRSLITDKERAQQMGRAARESVREKFNVRTLARDTLQFYGEVLSGRASSTE